MRSLPLCNESCNEAPCYETTLYLLAALQDKISFYRLEFTGHITKKSTLSIMSMADLPKQPLTLFMLELSFCFHVGGKIRSYLCHIYLLGLLFAFPGALGLVSGVVMAAVMVIVLGNFDKGLRKRSE